MRLCLVIVLVCFSTVCRGETWTSPDGKLELDVPIDKSLVAVANPPAPATAMWQSADGTPRLVVSVIPAPAEVRLSRAGLEEGTVRALPGSSVVSSTVADIDDVTVYTIAASKGKSAFIQQSVFAFDGNIYKVMTGGTKPVSADPQIMKVFASIRVLRPAAAAVPTGPASKSETADPHDLSVKLGEIGFGVLLVGGVIALIRRSQSKSQQEPPPLPPSGR